MRAFLLGAGAEVVQEQRAGRLLAARVLLHDDHVCVLEVLAISAVVRGEVLDHERNCLAW